MNRTLVPLSLALSLWLTSHAQLDAADKALIIGNGSYESYTRLSDPRNDADLMQGVFTQLGFECYKYKDLTVSGLNSAFHAFHTQISAGDDVVIFYSGHGLQVSGNNYIVPIDADISHESDLTDSCPSIDGLLKQLEAAGASLSVVFLDSCRTGLQTRGAETGPKKGIRITGTKPTTVSSQLDVLTCFSAEHGKPAYEGPGDYSFYTLALADELIKPRPLTISLREVRNRVIRDSNGTQRPFTYGSLGREIRWAGDSETPAPAPLEQKPVIVTYTGKEGLNVRNSFDTDSEQNLHGSIFHQVQSPLKMIGSPTWVGKTEWVQLEITGWVPIQNNRDTYLQKIGEKRWKVTWNQPGDNWVAMRTGTASTRQLISKVLYATELEELDSDFSHKTHHYILARYTGWAVKRNSTREYVRNFYP